MTTTPRAQRRPAAGRVAGKGPGVMGRRAVLGGLATAALPLAAPAATSTLLAGCRFRDDP